MSKTNPVRVSVIIPALNEEVSIGATLAAVAALAPFEIILADGGSTDRTTEIASRLCTVIASAQGRGVQQRTAAQTATGDVLWFLHADTVPTPGALAAIEHSVLEQGVAGGNFSLCFDGDSSSARRLSRLYPWLRQLGLCYGDSGIFVRKTVYDSVGGFQPYPLFEDVDLVRRVRSAGEFRTLPHTLITSSRRFEHRNFPVMFAQWTTLQLLYWAGVSPHLLARCYRPVRKSLRRELCQ